MRQEHDPLKVSNRGRVARQRKIKREILNLEGQILNQVYTLTLKNRKISDLFGSTGYSRLKDTCIYKMKARILSNNI